MKKKEILYAYIRVSTDEQLLKDLSIPRQKQLAAAKAKELGMEIEIFSEGGESASYENFDNRPKLFSLLSLVKEGVAKHIWVFDQTRLSRNDITKAVILSHLKKSSAQVYTFSKMYDFNKQEDILTFNILAAIESYESALRKARFQLGYVSGNQKGRFLKNVPPYGYKKDKYGFLVVDEEEKKVFLEIVERYLKGYGTNRIAKWLNEENVPTKTSKIFKKGYTLKRGFANRKREVHKDKNKWNPGTILNMLTHELYTGKRRFTAGKDPKTGKDVYETVWIDPFYGRDVFDRIQIQMKSNAINKKKLDKYFYLVKDLIQCGNCGSSMHGRTKPNRAEYTYRCNSKRELGSKCDSRGINIDKMNVIVWNAFLTSIFYHEQSNLKIQEQYEDIGILNEQLSKLDKDLKKLTMDEKVLSDRKTILLRRGIDPRVLGKEYDMVMNELLAEQVLNQDNRSTLLSNIAMINRKLNDLESNKTQAEKDLDTYTYAKLELDSIAPPFKSKEMEEKARLIIKRCIKNIVVKYNPATRDHDVDIVYNDLAVINNKQDMAKEQFQKVPTKTIKVKRGEKVNLVQKIHSLPGETITIDGSEYIVKDTWGPTGQKLPPLQDNTKSLMVW